MLCFNLDNPVRVRIAGEFNSPERNWKHLTRVLLDYEMIVVFEGVLYIADDKREYEVRAGEYLIMSPTSFQHGTQICNCRFFWLHFNCEALPASLTIPHLSRVDDMPAVCELFRRLIVQDGRDHRGMYSRYLASELLFELAKGQSAINTDITAKQRLCAKIKDYVERRRFSEIRIGDIAREMSYHEKYLSVVFSQTEGVTLKAYIEEQKIAEAKRLLCETDDTVSEIAYHLGFKNPHNFSRFFRTSTGETPLQWRKKRPYLSDADGL